MLMQTLIQTARDDFGNTELEEELPNVTHYNWFCYASLYKERIRLIRLSLRKKTCSLLTCLIKKSP